MSTWFVLSLAALVWFTTACGHKAKVQTPKASGKATSATRTAPPAPSNPRAGETLPTPSVAEARSAPKSIIPQETPPPPPAPAPTAFVSGPPIRIGLDTAVREVRVSAAGEFYLLEKKPEAARESVRGELLVRVERTEESAAAYRVQAASYSKSEKAEDLRKRLAVRLSVPTFVHLSPENGRYQVRVGEFATREEAQAFARDELVKVGVRDYFIVKENVEEEGGEPTLALRGAKDLFRINKSGFLFFPASTGALLRLNGKPYRGFLDLSLNRNGRLTVVNELGVEEYILGVVPAEISPDSYPEVAALAAQSIAARTYALKNLGRFRSDGFDLTADVRTQVYAGAGAEKEATNEAVRRTSGLAIYYQGQLIDAMYTSTCGGRTEDFANVFDAAPVPYLKGVACAAEAGFQGESPLSLRGTHDITQPIYSDEGRPANRDLELAQSLGLAGSETFTPAYLNDPPAKNEALRWIDLSRRLSGKNSEAAPSAGDLSTRASFLRFAAESFFGAHEIERRVTEADADYYLANLKDGNTVPRAARRALAYLMQQGLWHPDPENRARPEDPIRRVDAISLLLRLTAAAQPQVLRKGNFMRRSDNETGASQALSIAVKTGNRIQQFPLSAGLRLFLASKDSSTPADDLKVIGNEKVSFHLADNGSIDFLEVELNPTGTSSDRFSPVATWDTTLTRAEIEEKLRSLASGIGEFRDLKPSKLGTSGRAVQIQVIGSRRSIVLNGFKVRNALGLRDTLFTISRAIGGDGSIESFTFHGRGWGHGVGLCQVGAYGLARAGKNYEEILKTYYQGVEIRKAY